MSDVNERSAMLGTPLGTATVATLLVVSAMSVGCSTTSPSPRVITPRPLGSAIESYTAPGEVPKVTETQIGPALGSDILVGRIEDIGDAWAAALMKNPELRAFSWEIRAAEAREVQAGLRPNPTASVDVENIGGTGNFEGVEQAETTFGIGQLFELGAKRRHRVAVAGLERELAGWDYEEARMTVLTEVARRWIDVVIAQRQLSLADQNADLAQKILAIVDRQIQAGTISPVERDKQLVESISSNVAVEQAKRNLDTAQQRLAAMWGEHSASLDGVDDELAGMAEPLSLESILTRVDQNPAVARWPSELAQRAAALDLAHSDRIPDLEAAVGVRRFTETDDTAMIVGLSIPLPLFDRNQGAIAEAGYKLSKAHEEQRAARVRVTSDLKAAYGEYATSYSEVLAFRDEALPAAQRAFEAAREGFERGHFDFLAVLDAQRTLIEIQAQLVDATARYHRAIVEIEGLIGQSLQSIYEENDGPPNSDVSEKKIEN